MKDPEVNNIFLTFNTFQNCNIRHAITTRHAGNMQYKDKSASKDIIKNRLHICRILNLRGSRLTTIKQIHTDSVFIPEHLPDAVGNGIDPHLPLPEADAIVTAIKDTPFMIFSADCPPVLLFDPSKDVLGLIHASWRSILSGIIENTISKMKSLFNANLQNIIVAIGPGADVCCYEVGEDFKIAIDKDNTMKKKLLVKDGKLFFDLKGAIFTRLEAIGIPKENIEINKSCTICNTQFFSYRREGSSTGRFTLVAAII